MTTKAYMPPPKTVEWGTPDNLFRQLDSIHNFTLDPAATADNAKCSKFYTKEDDGLLQSWAGERVFCNPPYGRGLDRWLQKAYLHFQHGGFSVLLLPARTDTAWFHNYCLKGKVEFLRGRLKYGGQKNSAPFPSMLVIFDPKEKHHA